MDSICILNRILRYFKEVICGWTDWFKRTWTNSKLSIFLWCSVFHIYEIQKDNFPHAIHIIVFLSIFRMNLDGEINMGWLWKLHLYIYWRGTNGEEALSKSILVFSFLSFQYFVFVNIIIDFKFDILKSQLLSRHKAIGWRHHYFTYILNFVNLLIYVFIYQKWN